MKKYTLGLFLLLNLSSVFPQVFEIHQITSGNFDAKNPIISFYDFENGWIYFEKHSGSSSNIILIKYDSFSNSFQDTVELTSGNAMRLYPYEDFNRGIVFQTNENGNWDIAYRPYSNGVWGSSIFLTNSAEDEFNLSPFYKSDLGFAGSNFILFERSDTIIVLEYNETMKTEHPVLINSSQYNYSDYVGIYYYNVPGYYPRPGIHIIAVETDSTGNQNLISRYKPDNGNWDIKNIIKENCNCQNPILQFYSYSPHLIFEDSTSYGRRFFKVYDWEYYKDIDTIPVVFDGDLRGFSIGMPMIITSKPNQNFELEYFPHSYYVESVDKLKLRLNKQEYGSVVGDTLINISYEDSRMALGALGFYLDQIFYTIWEDSSSGHIHLFGRRQLYPVDIVSGEKVVTDFSLNQNYPNPFNPSTKIKFTIPQFPLLGGDGRGGLVTLKVYNVLGKEVATIVNEELPAGEYEVEFSTVGGQESSIQNPASGIYFYQLRAGDFIQTKKMVLLK